MHVVHLAVAVDLVTGMLQEVSDNNTAVHGRSREERLNVVYQHYKTWANDARVEDRAGKRLFSTGILTNSRVVEVSQKVLSAGACRYLILWASIFMRSICENLVEVSKLYACSCCISMDVCISQFRTPM